MASDKTTDNSRVVLPGSIDVNAKVSRVSHDGTHQEAGIKIGLGVHNYLTPTA